MPLAKQVQELANQAKMIRGWLGGDRALFLTKIPRR